MIFNLPRGVLQFAVNASIDTLATNANLKRWGKRRNAKCDLCGHRETVHHVLNNCEVLLERYKWHHNSILKYLIDSTNCTDNEKLYSDLSGMMPGCSTVPVDILITKQKPDLVIVNRCDRCITMLELSVAFETNIESTHELKINRYQNLISDIENTGYKVKYYALEIGSRGYISPDNHQRLKSFVKCHVESKLNIIKDNICKTAPISSFIIYHSKFEQDWINPGYVEF